MLSTYIKEPWTVVKSFYLCLLTKGMWRRHITCPANWRTNIFLPNTLLLIPSCCVNLVNTVFSLCRSCAGMQQILIISWKLLPMNQKLITAIVNSTLRNIISFLNLLVCIWALISKCFALSMQLFVFVSLLFCSGMKSHQRGIAEANLLSGGMGSSLDGSSRFELTKPRIWIWI